MDISSNTTPVVVLRFEGENPEALARIQAEFKTVILAAKPDAELPIYTVVAALYREADSVGTLVCS